MKPIHAFIALCAMASLVFAFLAAQNIPVNLILLAIWTVGLAFGLFKTRKGLTWGELVQVLMLAATGLLFIAAVYYIACLASDMVRKKD